MTGKYCAKVVLVGNQGVSKTTLLKVLLDKQDTLTLYGSGKRTEAGISFTSMNRHEPVTMEIWDTCGQEKYRSLTASYYRGANGCLVLYDVTRESSFDSITYWLHDLKEYTSQPKISTIIVGTKCHVPPEKREVTFERATKFAESLGLPYMEVSAEEGINVTEVFEKLADLIIENLEKSQAPITIETNRVSLTSQVSKRKHSWCSC